MAALVVRELCKDYPLRDQRVRALCSVNMTVADGSFITIVGRSGCGKTTLLRVIGGLEDPSAGEVLLKPAAAKIGMVFQEPRLLPWFTVEENMALVVRSADRQEAKRTVRHYLEILGLARFCDAYPDQLSGGMAQRVAVGRALCYHSDIILMDEPLSALDAFTRRGLQQELVQVFLTYHTTILFVTHDIEEALLLGQRVMVMEGGSIIREFSVPFDYPRNAADAAFCRLRESVLDTVDVKGE